MSTAYTSTPHPLDTQAVDLLMHVGSEYTLPRYIREARAAGVSKRIPAKSIPQGIVPGVSRLFLWHSQVIPMVKAEGLTMKDLTARLIEMGKLDAQDAKDFELNEAWRPEELLLPDDYVPPRILHLACIIQDLEPEDRSKVEKDFAIEWQGAVFSWAYMGRVQVVVPDGKTEQDIPDEIKSSGQDIDYVHVKYKGEIK